MRQKASQRDFWDSLLDEGSVEGDDEDNLEARLQSLRHIKVAPCPHNASDVIFRLIILYSHAKVVESFGAFLHEDMSGDMVYLRCKTLSD